MIQSTADFLPVLPESGHLGSSIVYFHPPTITKKGRLLDTIEYTTSSVYLLRVTIFCKSDGKVWIGSCGLAGWQKAVGKCRISKCLKPRERHSTVLCGTNGDKDRLLDSVLKRAIYLLAYHKSKSDKRLSDLLLWEVTTPAFQSRNVNMRALPRRM